MNKINRLRWTGVLTCLLASFLAKTLSAEPPGVNWSLPTTAFEHKPPLDRSIESIQFEGLETISPEWLRTALALNLDVLESQHSSIDDRTFRQVVERELARGFEHCGYLEFELTCDTRPSEDDRTDHLHFQVIEGPRFLRGELAIRFESDPVGGADDAILVRVKDHLLAATFLDNKVEKPIWEVGGIAWYGHRSTWAIAARIRDAIRTISDQADSVGVQIELMSAKQRVRLVVTLPDDFVCKQPSQQTVAADKSILANPVTMELQKIHREHFQDCTPGYEMETNIEDLRLNYATVANQACLEMVHQDGRHAASAWLSPNELLTSFQPGGNAVWRLPVRNGRLLISLIEDDTNSDDFRLNFTMNAASNRNKDVQPDPSGFRIDAKVWQRLFPESTKKEVQGNVIVYQNGDNEIRCDSKGVPQHLILIRSPDKRVTVNRIGNTYFAEMKARLFPLGANRWWVIRPDQDAPGKVQTLSRFLYGDGVLGENAAVESDEGTPYWIPPKRESVDTTARVVLQMARELNLVRSGDALDPLLKLGVLTHSKRLATVPERLDEALANDGGAISDVAFAWFAIEAKCYSRAKKLLDRSRVDSGNVAKVQHNVRRWLERDSMLGQVLSQTDVQAICDYVITHLGANVRWATAAGKLKAFLPVATTDDERYENAINTLSFGWISMHSRVLDPLTAHVDAKLEAKKKKAEKVAQKKKANSDKKANGEKKAKTR